MSAQELAAEDLLKAEEDLADRRHLEVWDRVVLDLEPPVQFWRARILARRLVTRSTS